MQAPQLSLVSQFKAVFRTQTILTLPCPITPGKFAKESKQNGTAAEAFCVGAAAALIRRRLNGAAAEFAALTAALARLRPQHSTEQLLTDPEIFYLRISVPLHLWATPCAML